MAKERKGGGSPMDPEKKKEGQEGSIPETGQGETGTHEERDPSKESGDVSQEE